MRELIDRGHLFIAQPPLYKVKRGKSEQYLKDERALEDYLIDAGLDDAVLKLAYRRGARRRRPAGDRRGGARDPQRPRRAPHPLRPQGRRAGGDRRRAQRRRSSAIRRRRAAAAHTSRAGSTRFATRPSAAGQGTFVEGEGFRFERTVRGVKEVAIIDPALLDSADARKLDEHAAALQDDLRQARHAAPQGRGDRRSTARATCSRRSPRPAARASRCSATRASAR